MLLILLAELIVNDVSEVINFMNVHFAERGVYLIIHKYIYNGGNFI